MLRNNSLYNKMIIIALSLCLLLPSSFLGGQEVAQAATAVNLSSGVTVSLYDAQIVKDESGKLVAYTLIIQNNSSKSVQLIDYWAKIKGGNNKAYITKLITEDKAKKVVIPNSSTYLTYYAYVDDKEQLTDLKIDIIRWDFGVNNYESVVGQIKSADNGVTTYKKAEELIVNKSSLNMLVSSYKMYSDEKYSYLNVDLSMRNKSNTTVDMKAVSYYLSDGKGTLIPLVSSVADLTLKPQERKTILLSTTVAKNFAKENASIVVMYKDEEGGLSLPRITFGLPVLKDTVASKANTATSYQVDGSEIAVTVKDSTLNYSTTNTKLKTKITLENKSSSKLSIPGFEYFIKTEKGYLYPLLPAEGTDTNLLPKIKKDIELEGEMPSDIDLKKSQFVLFLREKDSTNSYFLGNFKISIGSGSVETKPASNSVTYQGNFVEQVSLQRIPNGVKDLLIAEFKVTNKGTKAQAMLKVNGQFEIDGVKLAPEATKVINLDGLLAIAPNQSYRIITYTEIPYIQSANNIVFNMNEQATEGVKKIHQFKVSAMTKAKLLGSNESYKIDTLGSRGEVTVIDSQIYSGKQTDMFFAQLQYENKEQRSAMPSKLKGYIENSNQDIIDLNVKNYESKILPNGKVVLSVWAVIPKNYEDTKLNLYIGESVAGAAAEGAAEVANVIINPVYTQHIFKEAPIATDFSKLSFMNYDVSLYSFYAQLDTSQGFIPDTIKVGFNYDIVARENAPAYSDAQSIVVEYVDPTNSLAKFSQVFPIGDGAEGSLAVATRQKKEFSYTNSALQAINPGTYQINIYAQYQNHKKLIATSSFLFGNVQ